jgi:CDP-diacylglycerol---glycerol-3-phosphate 3-phosphatidyltransferase
MPTVYDLKPAFQGLLRPLTRRLAAAGITANQVTVLAVLASCAVGACITWRPHERWPLFVVPAFLFVRMALNAIDGMLAREHNQKSRLGAVLNELGDVVSDSALYLPLALVPGFDARLVVLIVLLAVFSEMAGMIAVQIGTARRYDGPMGKSDRAFVFGLIALLLACGVPAHPWLNPALGVIIAMLVLTIVKRCRNALAQTAPPQS